MTQQHSFQYRNWRLLNQGELDAAYLQAKVRSCLAERRMELLTNYDQSSPSLIEFRFQYSSRLEAGTSLACDTFHSDANPASNHGCITDEYTVDDSLFAELSLPVPYAPDQCGPYVDQLLLSHSALVGLGAMDRRATILAALRRSAISQTSPMLLHQEDLRYRRRKMYIPRIAVFFMLDASGSMHHEQRALSRVFFSSLERFVEARYPHADIVYILHNTAAWETTAEAFYGTQAAGGTLCSSTFALAYNIIAERFRYPACSIHLFYLSDGGNLPGDYPEIQRQMEALWSKAHLVACINTTRQPGDTDQLYVLLTQLKEANSGLRLARLCSPTETGPVLRQLLSTP